MGGPPQMQYRPWQAMQGQFPPVSGPSTSQGPCYPQMTVCPIGQPSPPVYGVRAPATPMTEMSQTQNFEPLARERKIIQIKDPEQSASSRTSPLSSQHQAEANLRAQFAAQVTATLAKDSESEDSMSEDSEMDQYQQYRPQQATQGQFTPLAANAAPVVRAPTAPMTGMPQCQTQNFESSALERKIIQINDPEQSANSRTSPLSSQHQTEANVIPLAWPGGAIGAFLGMLAGPPYLVGLSSASIGAWVLEQYIPRQATMNPTDTHRTGLYYIFLSVFSVPPLSQATVEFW